MVASANRDGANDPSLLSATQRFCSAPIPSAYPQGDNPSALAWRIWTTGQSRTIESAFQKFPRLLSFGRLGRFGRSLAITVSRYVFDHCHNVGPPRAESPMATPYVDFTISPRPRPSF